MLQSMMLLVLNDSCGYFIEALICGESPVVPHSDLCLTLCGCRTGEKVQEQRAADAEAAHGAGRAEAKRHLGAG